jgi:GT2 family glycosyltransferase
VTAAARGGPRVAAVIVAYEGVDLLRACVEALRAQTHPALDVLIVDNSVSGAVESAFSADPSLDYARTDRNVGFSRGCNLGIARALESGADFVWLLNPDTVPEPACLAASLDAAAAFPDAGVVGACIRYSGVPERVWYGGGRLDYATGVGKHLREAGGAARQTGYVTGCSMLIPAPVLRRVGGLEERIFMYLDDAEFCMRVRAAGYRLVYAPAARMTHAVGPGADWRRYPEYYLYLSVRNRPLVSRSGAYRVYLHFAAWAVAAGKALRYGLWRGVPERRGKLRAIALGAWDSLFAEAREERRFPALFRR